VWNIVLLVQAIPYLAAVMMSAISAFSRLSTKKLITRITALPASVADGGGVPAHPDGALPENQVSPPEAGSTADKVFRA